MEFIKPILENGDSLTAGVILTLIIVGMIYGFVTGNLEIGSSIKERKKALKDANDALDVANKELRKTESDLVRLQVEKELLWRQSLMSYPESPITVNRKRKQP